MFNLKNLLVFTALLFTCVQQNYSYDWNVYTEAIYNESFSFQEHNSDDNDDYVLVRTRQGVVSDLAKGFSQFNCQMTTAPSSSPVSVHTLRPMDIAVVGAIGDSLTAANGARAVLLFGVLEETRGVSWSIGGEQSLESIVTLPNILKKFNSKLYGYSLGSGKYTSPNAIFNVARPGHTAYEIYEQAKDLVSRMRRSTVINFTNDWKLVTLFIGGNDLCDSCKDPIKYNGDNYIQNLRNTLDYLHQNLPKTLVNLVVSLNVLGIQSLNRATCRNMHKALCDCAITPAYQQDIDNLAMEYQKRTEDLIATGRYDRRTDFTVVVQPMFKRQVPPNLPNGQADYSYFAPDCFHFSTKGHETAAIELWNTMLTPVGKKPDRWIYYGSEIKCPTNAAPFIFTNRNSNLPKYNDGPY